jgi:gamma-carbonic anhydrase
MKGIYSFGDQTPRVGARSLIAPGARVIGNVTIGNDCGILYNAVLRGDINSIEIGDNSNVQDNATVHLAYDKGVVIGKNVTIGHNAVVHACTIEDGCIIGMGAIVMDGAVIGHNSIVGAGALVTSGKVFPPHSLITGSPARVARPLTDAEIASTNESAAKYVKVKDQILRSLERDIQ